MRVCVFARMIVNDGERQHCLLRILCIFIYPARFLLIYSPYHTKHVTVINFTDFITLTITNTQHTTSPTHQQQRTFQKAVSTTEQLLYKHNPPPRAPFSLPLSQRHTHLTGINYCICVCVCVHACCVYTVLQRACVCMHGKVVVQVQTGVNRARC